MGMEEDPTRLIFRSDLGGKNLDPIMRKSPNFLGEVWNIFCAVARAAPGNAPFEVISSIFHGVFFYMLSLLSSTNVGINRATNRHSILQPKHTDTTGSSAPTS